MHIEDIQFPSHPDIIENTILAYRHYPKKGK